MEEVVAGLNRGDIEGSFALQTSDAHALAPLRPAEIGSAAIRASLANLFKEQSLRESRTLEEVEVHGSWAFTSGSHRSVSTPRDTRPAIVRIGQVLRDLKARRSRNVEVLQEHLEQ